MSKPGEQAFTWDNDIYSDSSGFRVAEEKTEVAKDDKTTKDDYEDYIYKTPKRKRKKSSLHRSSHHSHRKSHRKKHRNHKKHKMKTWKKVLLSVLCVFLGLTIIAAGLTAFMILRGQEELFTDDVQITQPDGVDALVQDGGQYIVYNGVTYKYNDRVTSLLFMGVDKKMDEKNTEGTGGQADVIVLMAMDIKNRKLTMMNIPRDTMTDVAIYSAGGYYTGMQRQQICLSYAYGDGKEKSCTNTVASVKRVFYNIPVNTYYSLDLAGLVTLNDAIGGVDVVSPETIEKFKQGESYHLMGNDADRFIEARVHDTAAANDLRMKRQQVYTKSFISKTMTEVKSDPSVALTLYNESAPFSCTNITPAKVTYLAQDIAVHGSLKTDIINVAGKTTVNEKTQEAEFNINEKEFYEQFLSVFYEKV